MTGYLESIRKQFRYYKMLGEKAIAQVPDAGLLWQYNAEGSSIAIIVKHLWGNMLSRWTDFLTADGGKEWASLSIPRGESRRYNAAKFARGRQKSISQTIFWRVRVSAAQKRGKRLVGRNYPVFGAMRCCDY